LTISLQPITRDNLEACINLSPREEQKSFVAPNIYSIAQAYVEPTWTPLAIYVNDTPVGFMMYGREVETGRDWIIRLMIDRQYQGRGYGRAATEAVIERIIQQPGYTELLVSYVPENTGAERLYQSLGFVATGEIEDGEIVVRLQRQDSSNLKVNDKIYHITTRAEWEAAQTRGSYTPANFAAEGFIHCSYPRQVVKIANSFFRGQKNLVLLSINRSLTGGEVKDENLEGGQELFPHLYGALPVAAVSEVIPLLCNEKGRFELSVTKTINPNTRRQPCSKQ